MFNIPDNLDHLYKQNIAAFLKARIDEDEAFAETCKNSTKTMNGVIAYVKAEAKKQSQDGCAVIPDADVYAWATHYIEEATLDFEPKAAAPKPAKKEKKAGANATPDVQGDTVAATTAVDQQTLTEEIDQLSLF